MPKEPPPIMGFDHNPAVGRYGFPIDKSKISYGPAIAKDHVMPRPPRIALDEVLDSGQQITSELSTKLLVYLDTVLNDDQMADVMSLLKGEEDTTVSPAMDRAMRRYADTAQRRYADKAKQRQESSAAYDAMFPNAKRLASGF